MTSILTKSYTDHVTEWGCDTGSYGPEGHEPISPFILLH